MLCNLEPDLGLDECLLWVDTVEKVLLHSGPIFLLAADAIFESICEGRCPLVTNSRVTSVTALVPHVSATAICFVSKRKNVAERFETFSTVSVNLDILPHFADVRFYSNSVQNNGHHESSPHAKKSKGSYTVVARYQYSGRD
jgi:hypothetical protein